MNKIICTYGLALAFCSFSGTLFAQLEKKANVGGDIGNGGGGAGSRVDICHIPAGNPSNAQNISVASNAVSTHLNNHGDFLGDCFSACNVLEVVSFQQGKQSNGTAVPTNRSHVDRVLEYDGLNTDGQFFSLGFGGQIVVKMEGGILNRLGNDLRIYETSFDQPSCTNYPERAEVWVSQKGTDWHLAGIVCQDGEVDIAPLDWIQFVKIVDVSDKSKFSGVVDGFDVDGISCLPMESQARVLVDAAKVTIYPNPAKDRLNLNFSEVQENQDFKILIRDISGKTVLNRIQKVQMGDSNLSLDISVLNSGVHFLQVESGDFIFEDKILIK